MRFDWDDRKAASNLRKHRIGFDVGITAFNDPFALIAADRRHSTASEERQWLIGESAAGYSWSSSRYGTPGTSTA